jgi:hypothetical protein
MRRLRKFPETGHGAVAPTDMIQLNALGATT